jgi:hypothetical protein
MRLTPHRFIPPQRNIHRNATVRLRSVWTSQAPITLEFRSHTDRVELRSPLRAYTDCLELVRHVGVRMLIQRSPLDFEHIERKLFILKGSVEAEGGISRSRTGVYYRSGTIDTQLLVVRFGGGQKDFQANVRSDRRAFSAYNQRAV